ncbi:S-layer-related duplication domain protein [Methanohalobium evestigatum Z-7303]|uniref:S-layer-related duplication domain protein n=1 Tax=Methanohalobium evestigatum (strain ATCC BAA-1072 / DSM 3721 / NBRC 107634 / OCM 161 / Z-7303) TaxID=644295 RepID=D7EB73_METEZ|nr:S-layer protein domain-containing protein [Methanohalobium evestigatum]ADI74590.1 S-layer-related duplication domain protein [Methanohalobium evestigatum Z-7303]
MNKILTMALSALMVLALFAMVSPASAEEHTVDQIDVRGPVWNMQADEVNVTIGHDGTTTETFTLGKDAGSWGITDNTVWDLDDTTTYGELSDFSDWRDFKNNVLANINTSTTAEINNVTITGLYNEDAQVVFKTIDGLSKTVGDGNGPLGSGIADSLVTLEANSDNFAAFWYDLADDESSENIIVNVSESTSDKKLEDDTEALLYKSTIVSGIESEFDFNNNESNPWTYQKIGFLAEEYVPIVEDEADKLSKLVMDDDTSHTIRTGESLELADGYAITPQQIDVEGDKVWLELTKDGEFVDDKVITVTEGTNTWTYDQDVMGEDDIVTLKVNIDEVFQGQVDSLAVIEGVWQIADDGIELESEDSYGNMEIDTVDGNTIDMILSSSITLNKDDTYNVMEDIHFTTADADELRFHLTRSITEPGTYEVRGTVANESEFNDLGTITWTPKGETGYSFAGFWYDLADNRDSEKLMVDVGHLSDTDRQLSDDPSDVRYKSTIVSGIESEFDFNNNESNPWTYQKIGFLAEEYVPIVEDEADKLSKLVMDDDTSHTIRTGESLELADGYAITPQQIDVEGDKVWLELTKDGEFVDDKVITVTEGTNTWTYDQDVMGEDDIVTLKVNIDEVFQGQVDSLAVIEGVWQIADDGIELESEDSYGNMEIDTVDGNTIDMILSSSITLSDDSEQHLMEDIYFKVADSDDVRFYPYVEKTIAGEEPEEDMPTAAFSASPMSGNAPLEVTFTDESENADEYEWDFGNGETSTDANPTTTYEEAGEYTVTLTVSNDAGEDTAEETITVNPEGTPEEPEMPTADFSANTTSGTAPLTVEFTDNSENAENYEWDFGNGETSTEANPTVTYEEADEYTVTLTVSNDAGEDTAETTITVDAAEEPGDGEGNGVPGFEAVFAIAGLLAIAFLVRRNRN